MLSGVLVVGCSHTTVAEPLDLSRVGEPFGPLAHVQLGMTLEEVRRAAPDLVTRKDRPEELERWTDAGIFGVAFSHGRAASLLIMPKPQTLRALHAAWGAGIQTGEQRIHYFDAKRTMRVLLADEMSLEFLPLVPFASMIGTDPHSFHGVALLGRKLDDALADFTAHATGLERVSAGGVAGLELISPTEWTESRSALVLQTDDQRIIRGWQWLARFDDTPEAKAAIVQQLDHVFGPPVTPATSAGDRVVRVYGTKPQVIVELGDSTSITVR